VSDTVPTGTATGHVRYVSTVRSMEDGIVWKRQPDGSWATLETNANPPHQQFWKPAGRVPPPGAIIAT
jgi:hypothetical protein